MELAEDTPGHLEELFIWTAPEVFGTTSNFPKCSVIKTYVSVRKLLNNLGAEVFIAGQRMIKGASGAPVYRLEDGKLVGVARSSIRHRDNQGELYIMVTHIRHVRELIRKVGNSNVRLD